MTQRGRYDVLDVDVGEDETSDRQQSLLQVRWIDDKEAQEILWVVVHIEHDCLYASVNGIVTVIYTPLHFVLPFVCALKFLTLLTI